MKEVIGCPQCEGDITVQHIIDDLYNSIVYYYWREY